MQDFGELDKLESMSSLVELSLVSNAVSGQCVPAFIPHLHCLVLRVSAICNRICHFHNVNKHLHKGSTFEITDNYFID